MPKLGAVWLVVALVAVTAGTIGGGGGGGLARAQDQDAECAAAALLAASPAASPEADPTPAAERPAWQRIELTEVCTGEAFTLADFAGSTVYVEPMATWCPSCRAQLEQVREARELLADEAVVFVALSVETDLPPADLADYAADAGFDWPFAVMSPEMLTALVEEFGRSAAVPPATPHFVIRPDGSTTDLETGPADADALVALVTADDEG